MPQMPTAAASSKERWADVPVDTDEEDTPAPVRHSLVACSMDSYIDKTESLDERSLAQFNSVNLSEDKSLLHSDSLDSFATHDSFDGPIDLSKGLSGAFQLSSQLNQPQTGGLFGCERTGFFSMPTSSSVNEAAVPACAATTGVDHGHQLHQQQEVVRRRISQKRPMPPRSAIEKRASPDVSRGLDATRYGKRNRVSSAAVSEPASTLAVPNEVLEDWQQRTQKRQRAVAIIKASEDSKIVKRIRNAQRGARTPDPADRSKSKRDWEHDVTMWRRDLRRLASQDGEPSEES